MNGDQSMASRFASLSRIKFNGALGASLVALAIGAIFVLSGLVAVGTAAFGPGVGKVNPEEELNQLVAQHNEHIKTWQDRLNGRSPFFKPSPPVRQPVVEDRPKIEYKPPDQPKVPDGPPSSYQGPPIAFAAGDTVYFNSPTQGDSKVLRVRAGEEKEGLRVISMSLPWSVKVGHKGGEYDVPLFNRSDQSAFVKASSDPIIFQDSFIIAVTPAPDLVVPPPTPTIDPAVTQAAVSSGEATTQRQPRERAAPQPEPDRSQRRSRADNAARPPRGAPPENAPPTADEEQPIEEAGIEEEPEEEGVLFEEEEPDVEEDPDAAAQVEVPSAANDRGNQQSSNMEVDDDAQADVAPDESK